MKPKHDDAQRNPHAGDTTHRRIRRRQIELYVVLPD